MQQKWRGCSFRTGGSLRYFTTAVFAMKLSISVRGFPFSRTKQLLDPTFRLHDNRERAQIDRLERLASSPESEHVHDVWRKRKSESLAPRSPVSIINEEGKISKRVKKLTTG